MTSHIIHRDRRRLPIIGEPSEEEKLVGIISTLVTDVIERQSGTALSLLYQINPRGNWIPDLAALWMKILSQPPARPLLSEPTWSMYDQIEDQRMERGEYDRVFVGRVDLAGVVEYSHNRTLGYRHECGCILIRSREMYSEHGDALHGPESWILFTDRRTYTIAWRVARLIKNSHRRMTAYVTHYEATTRGIYYILDPRHSLKMDANLEDSHG